MPFITEEIWQSLPHNGESIMVAQWPEYDEKLNFADDEVEFERIMQAIRAIRNRRAEMNVPPSRKAKVCIATDFEETFNVSAPYLCKLASASEVEVKAINHNFDLPDAVQVVTDSATIFIPMNELVDFEAELKRLEKDMEKTLKDKEFFEKKGRS